MAVTYEEAREIVRARFEPGWTHGTFCLDDRYVTETDEYYAFTIGAREFLVDGDRSSATMRIRMSRSVKIPTSLSPSITTTAPIRLSFILRVASAIGVSEDTLWIALPFS
jgi:hypothetical protein